MRNPVTRVENIARAGFFARGVVYILLGYFAFTGAQMAKDGTSGVLKHIAEVPGGYWLLAMVAIGLAAYGFFRLYDAALNLEPSGEGWKATLKRIGHAASGVAHLALAVTAVKLIMDSRAQAGGERQQEAAAGLLNLPFGSVVLGAIAIGFLFAALEQLRSAWTGRFMRNLDADAPPFTDKIGRAGYAARSVVFFLIGYALIKAAWFTNSDQVQGVGGALMELRDMGWAYPLTAIGLLLFGVFSLIMGKYRRIRDEDVIARLKQMHMGNGTNG